MWFLQNVQIITPALIINKENFHLSLQPNSGKSDPPAQLERERQTKVMKPSSWKKMHWLMEKNNSHCIFFRAHFCQQPKHKAKVKVQPLLCSFPPSGTLPAQGRWSRAWTLSPWMGMPLQPGCCRCLQVVCFPRKQQLLLLHFRWCSDQLVPIACSQRDGWWPAFWEIALGISAPS